MDREPQDLLVGQSRHARGTKRVPRHPARARHSPQQPCQRPSEKNVRLDGRGRNGVTRPRGPRPVSRGAARDECRPPTV
ncbi:hypothetical protein GEMMAAP_09720 [Gemmatimonas phototrophica]|uniref:Uncharacterized protein n=1 Tax=Gemmatimonas phototrophica TaxID=1379270 RepID=A0A143BKG6_9BACT|nr:hypothetical protein GEMMAAP_09720 [Gemmatimonas phototrophica]